MKFPFVQPDFVTGRASVILTLASVLTIASVATTTELGIRNRVVHTYLVSPVSAAYQSYVAEVEKQEQERAALKARNAEAHRILQEIKDQREGSNVQTRSTVIIESNSGNTSSTNETSQPTTTTTLPAQNQNSNTSTSDWYEQEVARMQAESEQRQAEIKAESDRKYQEALKDQQEWSEQKSAENEAWMEEQRKEAEAELEAWKEENGFN